jgi:hypothetical protein
MLKGPIKVKMPDVKAQGVNPMPVTPGLKPHTQGGGYQPANTGSKKRFTGANSIKGLEKA